jgi:beta-lactamase superfamily II metal-dependent hydrolase
MSGELQIVVWNVAHGSAIYVRTPNDRSILLDGGASEDFSPAIHLYNQYALRATDAFNLSHGDSDHVRDLPRILTLIPPAVFYRNPTAPRSLIFPTDPPEVDPLKTLNTFDASYSNPVPDYQLIHESTNWCGVEIGLFFNDGRFHEFVCLNDYSVVTVLNYGRLCFVFPGDLEGPGWEAMLARQDFVRATTQPNRWRVLIAPHHGHSAGVHKPLLDFFAPHLSIISGAYGDPHTDSATYANASSGLNVFNRGAGTNSRCKVLTTKRNDSVLLRADHQDLWITV